MASIALPVPSTPPPPNQPKSFCASCAASTAPVPALSTSSPRSRRLGWAMGFSRCGRGTRTPSTVTALRASRRPGSGSVLRPGHLLRHMSAVALVGGLSPSRDRRVPCPGGGPREVGAHDRRVHRDRSPAGEGPGAGAPGRRRTWPRPSGCSTASATGTAPRRSRGSRTTAPGDGVPRGAREGHDTGGAGRFDPAVQRARRALPGGPGRAHRCRGAGLPLIPAPDESVDPSETEHTALTEAPFLSGRAAPF